MHSTHYFRDDFMYLPSNSLSRFCLLTFFWYERMLIYLKERSQRAPCEYDSIFRLCGHRIVLAGRKSYIFGWTRSCGYCISPGGLGNVVYNGFLGRNDIVVSDPGKHLCLSRAIFRCWCWLCCRVDDLVRHYREIR
jgi:hypothetical protein